MNRDELESKILAFEYGNQGMKEALDEYTREVREDERLAYRRVWHDAIVAETRETVAREIEEASVVVAGRSDREMEAWWDANAHAARIARGEAS